MASKLRKFLVSVVVVALVASSLVYWNSTRGFDDKAMANVPNFKNIDEKSILAADDINSKLEPSYFKYFANLKDKGIQDTQGVKIVIPATEYSAKSASGISEQAGIGDRSGKVVVQSEENSWLEYTVDILQDGFYQMDMSYYAMPGKNASVLRDLQIDGKFPFYQAKRMEFQRMWTEAGPTWKDNQGNEYNPRQKEVLGWQSREFRDAEAKVAEPFRFYLTKGKHTLRISDIREPAAIGEIEVYSPVVLPTYAQMLADYKAKGYKEVKNQFIKIQAETASVKSDPTLRRVEDREPATEPFNPNAVGLNSFGSFAWHQGGQWAQWDFEVPETGLYNIGARFGSWWLDGMPVQRTVKIDGKVPFQELNAVNFMYAPKWQLEGFGGNDHPYLVYLTQGHHAIRMEVQVGSLGEVFEMVQDVSQKMSLLGREIIMYTGTNPDPNRDWSGIEDNVPHLVPRLYLMARELDDAMKKLYALGVQKNSSQVSALGMGRDQLIDMAKHPDTIPGRLTNMTDTESQLGSWITGLSQQALILDYLIVKSPDRTWPAPEASWLVRAWYSLHDFTLSFRKDYSGIGNIYNDGGNTKVLNVWIARGRDWAQIIKRMADEEFTPQTGIKVNVNILPANDMHLFMLSVASGKAPDVALGVDGAVPIDYAIRNAIVNLDEFPDYKQVAARFRPGALIPYKYNGGDFALPENQNFTMLFYRKDILQQLGIHKIPQTWDDVMDIIPILQQHGMDFYYPHTATGAIGELSPFLFQNTGEYYKQNGKESSLDSSDAYKAIKMWSGLFTNYKISKEANFYNRFRTGEMPIGVADYNTYMLLSTAAPELTGWWGMAPMPGVRQPDGTINRSTGGIGQTGMIFKQSQMKQQAWDFLKWWTSADVQEEFGNELESLIGVEARWNTANVEALKRLPWPSEDLKSILDQWQWFRERQVVLGGYYTDRYVSNIWNEIVLNGKTPREAIDDGVKEINKELRKKREEFGLDESSNQKKEQGGGNK